VPLVVLVTNVTWCLAWVNFRHVAATSTLSVARCYYFIMV